MRHHSAGHGQGGHGGHGGHDAMMNVDRHSESSDGVYDVGTGCNQSSTLTPMHLRKAKLMFFWCRYPSSSVLKTFFPDVKFNKNNTAQLVKWFSNFRLVLHFRSLHFPFTILYTHTHTHTHIHTLGGSDSPPLLQRHLLADGSTSASAPPPLPLPLC